MILVLVLDRFFFLQVFKYNMENRPFIGLHSSKNVESFRSLSF